MTKTSDARSTIDEKTAVGPKQQAFFGVLAKESDRGCVIVAAALIDELVQRLLNIALAPSTPLGKAALKSLLRSNGPLASSWAHNQVLLVTDTIDDAVYEDLEAIRKLRNKFAHAYTSARFSDREVQEVIFGMKAAEDVLKGLDELFSSSKSKRRASKTKKTKSLPAVKDSRGYVVRLAFTLIAARFAGYFEGFIDGHREGRAARKIELESIVAASDRDPAPGVSNAMATSKPKMGEVNRDVC